MYVNIDSNNTLNGEEIYQNVDSDNTLEDDELFRNITAFGVETFWQKYETVYENVEITTKHDIIDHHNLYDNVYSDKKIENIDLYNNDQSANHDIMNHHNLYDNIDSNKKMENIDLFDNTQSSKSQMDDYNLYDNITSNKKIEDVDLFNNDVINFHLKVPEKSLYSNSNVKD